MSKEANIALHLSVIRRTQRQYPIGSNQRLALIHRSLEGILRAKRPSYNPERYEGQ